MRFAVSSCIIGLSELQFYLLKVEGIMRNSLEKIFKIWTSGSGEDVLKIYFDLQWN